MARPGTKRHTVITIMTENVSKTMEQTVEIIQATLNIKRAEARLYYIDMVEGGLAPGVIVRARNARPRVFDKTPEARESLLSTTAVVVKEKTPKTPKVKAAKAVSLNPVQSSVSAVGSVTSLESSDDVAARKAANLERLKKVHDAMKARGALKVVEAEPEVASGDEVDQLYRNLVGEDDPMNFVPKFLHKELNLAD